ncbi:MAG: cytosine permease, partial [Actinomycetota bacterium]
LLGLAAVPAAATGVPAMVLYRAPLGVRGSLLPTACNVVQNLGWATFELFVIASAATAISERVFGAGGRPLWVLAFGILATAMAVAGPLAVLRRWLQRFAVWAVLASTAYLTWYALTRFDLAALADAAGQGGLSFWAGVDLAIALPNSWVPLVAGALLVPALGLWPALGATVVGAVVGNALLGLAAVPAAATGVPAMVLYRAPLGVRGSLLPTACNVVQNLGWATFELFVIATAATAISERVFGAGGRPLWVLAFGAVATAMAVVGPLTVLRRWLERFAVWAVLASTAYLTWYALTRFDLGALAGQAGQGGLSFWAGVDLAVALPVSWVPLVADYARFGRSATATFWGTAAGYLLAQVWFFALGVLFLLSIGSGDVIAALLAVPVGLVAMAVLVVDETDEVFANLYSAGVSLKNAAPGLPGRRVALALGAVATVAAILVDDLARYENFLFLLGALFVPLFGV